MLFGYDIGVISGAILFIKKDFSLSPGLEEVVVSSVLLGSLVGAVVGGVLADRLGRRRLLIITAVVFGHDLADCRSRRRRNGHRHRFVCRAPLHFRDCSGRYQWEARFGQSSRPDQRHRHFLFD
jgi:nitrate/nitrite transporter NarK